MGGVYLTRAVRRGDSRAKVRRSKRNAPATLRTFGAHPRPVAPRKIGQWFIASP
jgi:hypothetical protein